MRTALKFFASLGAVIAAGYLLVSSIPPLPAPKTEKSIRLVEAIECRTELTTLETEIEDAEKLVTRGKDHGLDVAELEKAIAVAKKALPEKWQRFETAKEYLDVFGAGIHAWHERFILNHYVNRTRLQLGEALVVLEPFIDRIDDSERSHLFSGATDKLRGPESMKLGRQAQALQRCMTEAEEIIGLSKIRRFDTTRIEAALHEARIKYPDPMQAAAQTIDKDRWSSAQVQGRSMYHATYTLQHHLNEHRILHERGMLILVPEYNNMWPLEERAHLLDN